MKNFVRTLSLTLLVSILPVFAWAQFSGNIQGGCSQSELRTDSSAGLFSSNAGEPPPADCLQMRRVARVLLGHRLFLAATCVSASLRRLFALCDWGF